MKQTTLFLLSFFFLACGSTSPKREILPVVGTIFDVTSSCYEDTLLDKKSSNTIRRIFLEISLQNPNDIDMYIPIRSIGEQEYCSEIEILKDTTRWDFVLTKNINTQILKPHTSTNLRILMFEHLDKNLLGVTHDLKELLKVLRFKYLKCETDTLFCKKKIADIEFVISDSLKIQYRDILDNSDYD